MQNLWNEHAVTTAIYVVRNWILYYYQTIAVIKKDRNVIKKCRDKMVKARLGDTILS